MTDFLDVHDLKMSMDCLVLILYVSHLNRLTGTNDYHARILCLRYTRS